jgi:hypothetical protein
VLLVLSHLIHPFAESGEFEQQTLEFIVERFDLQPNLVDVIVDLINFLLDPLDFTRHQQGVLQ